MLPGIRTVFLYHLCRGLLCVWLGVCVQVVECEKAMGNETSKECGSKVVEEVLWVVEESDSPALPGIGGQRTSKLVWCGAWFHLLVGGKKSACAIHRFPWLL
jgi:hypothetical protein